MIVAYDPDDRLEKSLRRLIENDRIARIIIVDNSDTDAGNRYGIDARIVYIPFKANKGIAFAQNTGIELAKKEGFRWILTLDQDTIIEADLLEKYNAFIESAETDRIAVVNSDYLDINTQTLKYGNTEPISVDYVISSGSLVNIAVYEKLGPFEEAFFIDQVDNEYCYRAVRNHYRILVLPGKGFEHRLGNSKRVKLFCKSFYVYNQSPQRTYYRTRNIKWFVQKYSDDKLLKKVKTKELRRDFIRIFFEKNTIKKLNMFAKGLKDGRKYKK